MPYICPLDAATDEYISKFCAESLTQMSSVRFKGDPHILGPDDVGYIDDDVTHYANGTLMEGKDAKSFICARVFKEPRPICNYVADNLPFTFVVNGQICPDDCFIIPATDDLGGFFNREKTQRNHVASFWVEERPNRVSHTEWTRLFDKVRKFVACTNMIQPETETATCDVSNLYRVDSKTHTFKLKFEWVPKPTESEVCLLTCVFLLVTVLTV